jgi:protein TonB
LIGVGVLHVGLIWALVVGLASGLIQKLPEELKAEVVKPTEEKKPPPPPPPDLAHPPPPFVPAPEITIAPDAAPSTAIAAVQSTQPTAPAPVVAPTPPKAVGRTHNCDSYYPDVSRRLNEQGTTVVQYVVGVDGSITNVAVRTSSGSERLDEAAVSCVQTKFRSEPATQGGKPVSVTTATAVQFKFK